jgi:hypothetical protein
MRKFLGAVLAAAALLSATAANAQTATQDITIDATVATTCTINNVATGTTDTATININADGSVNTGAVTPTSSPYANVACNAPSDLQVTSQNGGLTGPAAVVGFDNVINYSATATWNSVPASVNTATNAASGAPEAGTVAPVGTAHTGNLSVSITPAANSNPLVIGSYSDTLTVTVTPQ